MVPFKSLGAVSYSPSIIIMAISVAVCEIFSVKEWPDLENRVRVCSRSLEMAPIDIYIYIYIMVDNALVVMIIAYKIKYLRCLHPRSGHL